MDSAMRRQVQNFHSLMGKERAVQITKSILGQPDPQLVLMTYRSTAVAATGHSPSELMMGRRILTTLPVLPKQLKPYTPCPKAVEDNDTRAKQEYAWQYDRRHGVKELAPLKTGDTVRIKTDGEKLWLKKGVIKESHDSSRSFIVDTGDGVYRRNRRHVLAVPKYPQTSRKSIGIPTPSTSSERPHPPDEHLPERAVKSEAAMDASNQISRDLPPTPSGKRESKMPFKYCDYDIS